MPELHKPTLRPAFPDAALLPDQAPGPAIVVRERMSVGIATILARRSVSQEALDARLRALVGLSPPSGPRAVFSVDTTLVGVGPGAWLALKDGAAPSWPHSLADDLQGLAGVSDQSSGYAVLRMEGSAARDLLQRGLSIDLHPDAFPAGAAAVSGVAHIGVTLWADEDAKGFEIAVFRSMAAGFWHWLSATAEGAGVTLVRARQV